MIQWWNHLEDWVKVIILYWGFFAPGVMFFLWLLGTFDKETK